MKGVYYTLEAAISVFLIISFFVLLFFTTPKNPEFERANIKTDIYKGFDALNSRGSLRIDALNNNATAIDGDLDDFLPLFTSLDITIFNRLFVNLTSPHTEVISDTVVVSYYLAGAAGNYTPREIRAYVWGFK